MSTSTKQRSNTAVNLASLIPTRTAAAPDESLVDLVAVLDEGVDLFLLGDDVLDVLGGHLLDPLDEVVSCPVEGLDEGAVAAETVGAHHHEVVWHGGDGDGDVCFWVLFPLLTEVNLVEADDGIAGTERHVKASGIHDWRMVSILFSRNKRGTTY